MSDRPITPPPRWVLKNQGCSTTRQWKSKKRKELKAVCKALDEFQAGCAYVPGYSTAFRKMREGVNEMRRLTSCKEWGR